MSTRPEVGLADLARVLAALGPLPAGTLAEVVELLGLPQASTVPAPRPGEATEPVEIVAPEGTVPPPPPAPQVSTTPPPPPPHAAPRPYSLTPLPPAPSRPPRPLRTLASLLTSPPVPPATDTDLLPVRYRRAILGRLAATREPLGEILLDRLVATLATGEAVTQLPRRPVPGLGRGLQLLLDLGEGMTPFAADLRDFLANIRRLVGREGLTVLHFAGDPLRAGVGARHAWRDYRPPPPGTPVLAVTDLGIAHSDVEHHQHWRQLAAYLHQRGCGLRLLVPYPAGRWPRDLGPHPILIPWDRGTRPGEVHRRLGREK